MWARVWSTGGASCGGCLQGQWKKAAGLSWYFQTHRLKYSPVGVRTDLANRPTELMLVSFDSRYTKL